MAGRAAYEDRVYTVVETVELDGGITLTKGQYPGRLQWTEFAQPGGEPRIVSKRFVLPLSGEQVLALGGKLGRTQKLRELDVTKLIASGSITV